MNGRHETHPTPPLGVKSAACGEPGALERPKLLALLYRAQQFIKDIYGNPRLP